MSSTTGASPPTKLCFYHQCKRYVSVSPLPDGDVFCPHCCDIASFDVNPFALLSFTSPSGGGGGGGGPTQPFNPAVLHDHFLHLLSGGASIQVVLDGGGNVGGNLGDYFPCPDLERLIQRLAENDLIRYGTPPASKSAVANLPDIKISCDLLDSGEAQSAVCMDTFEIGSEAKQLPCKHIYQRDCIRTWRELYSSCPVWSYREPDYDPDYDQHRGAAASAAPAAGRRVSGAGVASAAAGTAGSGAPGGGNFPGRWELPDITINQLDSGEVLCVVCMDAFEIGSKAKRLPCNHIYHRDCILPWLERHISCPVCRFQLPADDPGYDQRRGAAAAAALAAGRRVSAEVASAAAGTAGRGAPGRGNSSGPQIVESRPRPALGWAFGDFGSQAEVSNASDGTPPVSPNLPRRWPYRPSGSQG